MVNELARQGFHLVAAGSLAVLAGVLVQHWFLLLSALVLVLAAVCVYLRFWFVKRALVLFDRPDALFPGKGAFMAVLGGFFSVLLFPAHAVAGLLVLALADSAATVVGVRWGRLCVPWSASKTWAGVATFFVVASGVLWFFSSWWLVVALFVTVVEAGDYSSYPFLDDNVLVPLTVAASLVVF